MPACCSDEDETDTGVGGLRSSSRQRDRCGNMSIMCSDVAANLLDTVPGRMLVQWYLRAHRTADPQPSVTEFVEADSLEDFVEDTLLIIGEYLYGNGANEILDLPVTSPAVREMSEAICAALMLETPTERTTPSSYSAVRVAPTSAGSASGSGRWRSRASRWSVPSRSRISCTRARMDAGRRS